MKILKLIKDDCCENEIKESGIVEDIKIVIRLMTVRGHGNFTGKAIYLPFDYNYVLGKDDDGYTILVPLKKKADCCK